VWLGIVAPQGLSARPPAEAIIEAPVALESVGPDGLSLETDPPPVAVPATTDDPSEIGITLPDELSRHGMNAGTRPRARLHRTLIDGEMDAAQADGTIVRLRSDALEQAKSVVPSARFVRVFPGDSLAKLAAEHAMDARKLALLNRTVVDRVYMSTDVVCLRWTHTVRDGETLERLAGIYNIEVRSLAELNDLAPRQPLHLGQELMVPGEFEYQFYGHGSGSLMLTRYVTEAARLPFRRESRTMRFEPLRAGESFDDFLARHDLAEDFVRKMNGLGLEDMPKEGDRLLIEHSVEVTEEVALDQLAQHFNVRPEVLSEVNQRGMNVELQPGQRVTIPFIIGTHHGLDAENELVEAEIEWMPAAAVKESVFEVELKESTP
jgi:hypothetical protein